MGTRKVLIIGGGICGLASARYLALAGWDVTVLDKGDFTDGCSFGNAGFICPSHYIQLATPGIARQGIKWMTKKTSPFYIQPRLDRNLWDWGYHFLRHARQVYVDQNCVALRDIGLLSQHEYEAVWTKEMDFDYVHGGMLEVFQTEKARAECTEIALVGRQLGLDIEVVDKKGLERLEPGVQINALGAVHYKCDGHLHPGKLMLALTTRLKALNVALISHSEVKDIQVHNGIIESVSDKQGRNYIADEFVLAAGAWSEGLARKLHLHLPLVGGRGYSFMVPAPPEQRIQRPGLLVEGRAAFTPLGDFIRFGGTMEVTRLDAPPSLNRVRGIIEAVKQFFPGYAVDFESIQQQVWSGFRPVSADGMPYLGRSPKIHNMVIATGHAQLGISLGAATGLLVSELVKGMGTSLNISTFAVNRFT